MAKIDKKKLDDVFRLTDNDDIYEFMKDEAYRNVTLSKKLIEHFLPEDDDDEDYRQEVENVFLSADESHHKWGPYMDWTQIGMGLWRMIDKAKYLIEQQKYHGAAAIACQIITSVGEEYTNDEVFNCQSYDGDHFCTDDSIDILIDIIEREALDKKSLKAIQKEITRASKMETYVDYCICNFDMLLCVLNGEFLSTEEHIKILDEQISRQRYNGDKNKWIMRKSSYLQRKGMTAEHAQLTEVFFGIPDLSRRVVDDMIARQDIAGAIDAMNKALDATPHDEYSYVCECHKRRMSLYEKIGDKDNQINDAKWLLVNDYSGNIYSNYLQLKSIAPAERFKNDIRECLAKLIDKDMMFAQKGIAKVCAEENEIDLLCACLSANDGYNNTEGYEIFKDYARLITAEMRTEIILKHIEALREQASRASSKNYSSIRYQMEQLRDCCSEAESFVSELAQEFKTEYKRRPAFMAELKRL